LIGDYLPLLIASMPLTILTDDDVTNLLHSLERQDILDLQQSLADALHFYSSGDDDEQNNNCSASNQPERISMCRKDGSTTLFMPGSSADGMGFKVVTLAESTRQDENRAPNLDTTTSSMSSVSISDASSTLVGPTPGSSIPSYPGSIVASSFSATTTSTSPSGSLTLLDRQGAPRAFINASEITAFRTALASTMIFNKRANVHDVVVFGAGKQAYWHARLALLLRPNDVHHLNVVNRNFDRSVSLMQSLFQTQWPVPLIRPKTEILTPSHREYDRMLKSLLRTSSVIFTTTPSTKPLFPPEILTNPEGRKKGRYIGKKPVPQILLNYAHNITAAIGSYKPHMVELSPEIIQQAIAPSHAHHHHKHAKQSGAVIVDSVEACLKEAGELIQAGASGRDVVELGELVMLKRDLERRSSTRTSSVSSESSSSLSDGVHLRNKKGKSTGEEDGGLKEWLSKGNVIYKSVGMSLMVSSQSVITNRC
jgi:ornithine cyclodeaminase/alanine dehydrogenase-like protein (mu-crystallin family)